MSFRAVVLGLCAGVIVAGLGYLNDQVLRGNFLVGNHFPISVFGLLVLGMATANPLLFRLRRNWGLKPAEVATATALVLVACSVPGSSLMRVFTPALMMPLKYNAITPGWQKNRLLTYIPPALMPAGASPGSEAVEGFVSGWGHGGQDISLTDVPWSLWRAPLTAWMPLIFLAGLCAISMSLVFHYQWARRERLRYPIADFSTTLMETSPGKAIGPIFRNKLFWLGVAVTFCLHVVNGTHAWFPGSIYIPMEFEIPLWEKFPLLAETPTAGRLLRPIFFPTFIAFAYFLASDVSFSLGTCQIIFVIAAAVLLRSGIDISQARFTGGVFMWERFGSYVAFAVLLGYTGRGYYRMVLRRAILPGSAKGTETAPVWAARVLLLSAGSMVAILALLGLAWPLALAVVGMLLLMYVVLARINAEAGLFHCEPLWEPAAVLVGIFGYHALGVQALLIVSMFTVVLMIDPRESIMPFVINGLKMADHTGVSPSRVGWTGAGALALALAVAVPTVLWANYNYGVQTADIWSSSYVPKRMLSGANAAASELRLTGDLAESEELGALGRLMAMRPDSKCLWAITVGAGGILCLSSLRRRLSWWPLHPVALLVAGTWPIEQFSHSFLLGWLIKTMVTKLAGLNAYRRTKPLMVGIVAGDLLGGLGFMAIGGVYYWMTGLFPVNYYVFPN